MLLAKVAIAVIRRYRKGTHHDPLPTAVEELLRAAYLSELGAFAWTAMKEKASAMWIDDGPAPGAGGHVGGYLLRKIQDIQKERPGIAIDLVGHSAGSIVICAMLKAIKNHYRSVKIRNVTFLAPAVRLDTFVDALPRVKASSRFRLFTMTDNVEKGDRLAGALYPRSLLFLISGLFEDEPGTPLAGLARHITARTASAGSGFDMVRAWLDRNDGVVLSPTADGARPGLQSRATKHGDFDNDKDTLASLLLLVGS